MLNVSIDNSSLGTSIVVGPITIEYIDAIIIPKIVYIVALLFLSKHFLSNLVKNNIPNIIPKPKTNNIGNDEKSKVKNAFILVTIGMYIPNINNKVDPEIPGNIIAEMAIIAAKNT